MPKSSGAGGHLYLPKYQDKNTREVREQAVYWCVYYRNGKRICESTRTDRLGEAKRFLQDRLRDRVGPPRRELEKVQLPELAELVRADYKNNGRRSVGNLERVLRPLLAAFDGWRAVNITTAETERYKADRLAAGYAPGTVNRELAALRRMFRLGKRHGLVVQVPDVVALAENNARKGFIEETEIQALLVELPEQQRAYRRYCIVDEAMLREGAEKLAAHLDAAARRATRKVVPIREAQA
ncbi:MAG: hypothetical protein HY704_11210 [Gemmatimonadetes bacterium]|nr:hypothetical protein [Gemmatimonadota bacterium]